MQVDEPQGAISRLRRPARYSTETREFDEEAEAAAFDDSADPTPNVLSGFLVLISPEKMPAPAYHVRLKTFDRRGPDAE
jgi:hypothetical protein